MEKKLTEFRCWYDKESKKYLSTVKFEKDDNIKAEAESVAKLCEILDKLIE